MHKLKLWAPLFVALGLLVSSGTAIAQSYLAPHMVSDPVAWRVHKATAATGEVLKDDVLFTSTGTGCNVCAIDSFVTDRLGVASTSSPLDTSVAVSTANWFVPPATGVAADSSTSLYFAFVASDPTGSACESGADSLYTAIQASYDGISWFTLNTFCGSTGTGYQYATTSRSPQTVISGQYQGLLSLNGAALSVGPPVWVYKVYRRNAAAQVMGFDVPDRCSCDKFPLLRFVCNFHMAKGYKITARVLHWSTL